MTDGRCRSPKGRQSVQLQLACLLTFSSSSTVAGRALLESSKFNCSLSFIFGNLTQALSGADPLLRQPEPRFYVRPADPYGRPGAPRRPRRLLEGRLLQPAAGERLRFQLARSTETWNHIHSTICILCPRLRQRIGLVYLVTFWGSCE